MTKFKIRDQYKGLIISRNSFTPIGTVTLDTTRITNDQLGAYLPLFEDIIEQVEDKEAIPDGKQLIVEDPETFKQIEDLVNKKKAAGRPTKGNTANDRLSNL